MGNKILESNPTLFGKNKNLTNQEKKYFNRVNNILRQYYLSNLYSDFNLEMSLEQKSFEKEQSIEQKLEDISWIENIYKCLNTIAKKFENVEWITELEDALSKEVFSTENKYYSNFFYNEYKFKTCPLILSELKNDLNEDNIELNNQLLGDLNYSLDNKAYNELDVTDHLGGSYLEINMDNFEPNDVTFQYKMKRKELKKYVKVFKEHIYNNQQHPINRVIFLFTKFFCRYINTNIDNINNRLKDKQLMGDDYEKTIKHFEKEITISLQDFIIAVHSSLKLFYSTCINYTYFKEEKEDLFNLITCLVFKTGKLYESIYSLYSITYSHDVEKLQEKFNDLKNVKPKDLELPIKFCLDEDTLELQRKILKDKQNEKDQKENEDQKKENIEEKKIKKDNELYQIKESEENEEDNERVNSKVNIINTNKDIDTNINNNIIENDDEEGYLLEKINEESIDTKDALSIGFMHLRNTINCFNNKKYLFPKIRNNLRDTLALNDKYIQEAKNSGKLPIPFYSAINLLKNLKNYKTPFEKIVILAALSDQITESVSDFWSSMMNYIKNSFLFIEADEIMNIFAFIIIKSQMPELFVESKIINNFTTSSTRAFNISYNFTLLEASLETISEMKNSKELANREKQLKEVRKSIAVLTTQRLSRLSRMSTPGNNFS